MTRSLKLLIVIYHRFELWRAPEWFAERIQREFPNVEAVRRDDYTAIERDLLDTDVLMSWSITAEQLAVAKKLRWIHSPAAAVHRLMIPELIESDVVVTSARGIHGPVVAEHVIALVLALAKRLPSAVRYQLQKKWGQELLWNERPRPREIAGATLGLVGLGSIGTEVARLAGALGMRVIAVRGNKITTADTREHEGESRPVSQTYGPDEIDVMLAQADYVVLAAPVTPRTRGLINTQRLAAMKRDAYLINIGRGALIDEPALLSALRERRIAGAALDVFEQEPLAEDSPFWEMDNVLITPHSAALTERLWERHFELLSDNLRRFMAGAPLLGMVDKARGY
jgi:phosphoglycerate dehydrogenase-like enzyme